MFVSSLNIREFRGIKRCKGSIIFSNFTVIIGRNNSGKSTILEALSLLPHPESKNVINNQRRLTYLQALHPSGTNERLLYRYAGNSTLDYNINIRNFKIDINYDKIDVTVDGKSTSIGNYHTFFNMNF